VTPCPVVAEQSADQLGPDAAVWSSSVSRVGAEEHSTKIIDAPPQPLLASVLGSGYLAEAWLLLPTCRGEPSLCRAPDSCGIRRSHIAAG